MIKRAQKYKYPDKSFLASFKDLRGFQNLAGLMILMLSVLLFSMPVHAEPGLLWKKTFDSRIVKTSRLMDFQLVKGKGGDFPLKAVMTEKSIFVLDHKGKIEKRISLEDYDKAAMSDHGTAIAAMKGKEITISDLDEHIRGIVRIHDPQPVVLPQHVSLELSPDGKYIVILSYFTHTLYFHNDKGELISEYKFDDLKGAEIKFSEDSRYSVVHMPNWGDGKTSGFIVFFNDKRKKLWKFGHKGCEAVFDISADGNFVGIAANNRFYSLNSSGKIVYEKILIPGDIDIQLSPEGKYVAMTQKTEHRVSLLDNQSGNVLWSEHINGFDPLNSPFTCLDISKQGNITAVAISKDWTKQNKESFLYLFDKSGSVLLKDVFNENIIQGNLSFDGKCMLILGNENAYFHKI